MSADQPSEKAMAASKKMEEDRCPHYDADDAVRAFDCIRCRGHALDAFAEEARKEAQYALRTRPDYDFRCDDCGAPHILDTSIPSATWNAICDNRPGVTPGAAGIGMPEVGALCTLCIDDRLVKAGLTCDVAEFYFNGRALSSRLYAESTGEVEEARREEREACAVLADAHKIERPGVLYDDWNSMAAALARAIRSRSSRPPEVGAGASDFDEHCAPDNCCVCDSRLCTSEECGKPRHDGSVQTTSGAWCCSEKCWGIIAAKAEHSEAGAGGEEEQ